MQEINASIGFDKRLYAQDIAGSKAHAAMLAKQGIISKSDAAEIRRGLDQVQAEIEEGTFTFSTALEDIHLAQTRSYLHATGLHVGLLLNFNAPTLIIKRIVF